MSRLLAGQESLYTVGKREFQKLPALLPTPGPLAKSRHILVTSGKTTFSPATEKQINSNIQTSSGFQGNLNDPSAEARS